MKNLAIIPARGGSKRIPGKNIKDFLGKPIIAYSIEAALESKLFDEVMVSTDDIEIAELAKRFGAKAPFFRSEKNADDSATLTDVLIEVVKDYEEHGVIIENVCCILPTAPFVTSERIIEGYEVMQGGKLSAVFPVLRFSYPIQRALKVDNNGKVSMIRPENLFVRSQDLMPAFHDSGQFYWVEKDALLNEKTIFAKNTGVIKLSELEAHDIDTPEDWNIAEMKYKILRELEL